MQSDRDLLRQALEALEHMCRTTIAESDYNGVLVEQAITALRERLARQEQYQRPQMRRATREEKIDKPGVYWVPVKQEPVAWMFTNQEGTEYCSERDSREGVWTPLYVSPNTIANSEAIPEQISEPKQAPKWQGARFDSALHEQPEQEPVAWRDHVEQRLLTWRQSFVNRSGDQLALDDFMDKESLDDLIDYVCDEYTTPPRREWVGLTLDDMEELAVSKEWLAGTRWAEAKLKEKNDA